MSTIYLKEVQPNMIIHVYIANNFKFIFKRKIQHGIWQAFSSSDKECTKMIDEDNDRHNLAERLEYK